ncbi:MAG: type 4a pilus biogenesis protein PilO [Acidobacteriota bacterium]|nr:type 4a pilus biogenesis protein PilO [Acidobacteriota bacterium]
MNLAVRADLLRDLRPDAVAGVMVAAVVLTLLAGYLYLLGPSIARYRDLARAGSEEALQTALDSARAGAVAISATESELESIRKALYGGASELAPEKLESFVIDRLDRISVQRDVALMSVKPDESDTVLMFDEFPYDVDVSGDYFAIYEWLQDVEKELRPMIVKQFALDPDGKGGRVKMKLRLVSYRPRETT